MGQDAPEGQDEAVAKRRGRGRPSKSQEILARMVAVHAPGTAGPTVFEDLQTSVELVEDIGPAAKLSRISEIFARRLGKTVLDAESALDSEGEVSRSLVALRPWADDACPENVVHRAEAQYWANERVVSALLAHLAEHVVVGEELRSQAAAARRRAAAELAAIPATMVDFVNRLMASGVGANEVKNMSRERLAAVMAAIRGSSPEAEEGRVPTALPAESVLPFEGLSRNSPSSTEGGDGGVDGLSGKSRLSPGVTPEASAPGSTGGIEEEDPGAGLDVVRDDAPSGVDDPAALVTVEPVVKAAPRDGSGDADGSVGETAEPDGEATPGPVEDPAPEPLSEQLPEPASDAGPVVPAEPPQLRWGRLDLSSIGYRVELVTASSEREVEALRMRMPEVDGFRELAMRGTSELLMADGVVENRDRTLLEKFYAARERRTREALTPMERRVWALLLVELPRIGQGRSFGAGGWYDGLAIPAGGDGAKVWRIVAEDRSEEGLRDALKG